MGTRRTRVLVGIGAPFLVVLVLLAAWAIDTGSASGKVPPNVELAGHRIGRLAEDRLAVTVRDVAAAYAKTQVQVRVPGHTYQATASSLGLALDEEATIRAALDLDRGRALAARPLAWLTGFASARRAPLRFTVSDDGLAAGLSDLQGLGVQPREPSLVDTGSGLAVVSGHSGQSIDSSTIKSQLLHRASSGELPIVVESQVVDRDPAVSEAGAEALATRVNGSTANGLVVRAGGRQVLIASATVRSWLGSKPAGSHLELTLDAKRALAELRTVVPTTPVATDARLQVNGWGVVVVPSQDATRCCAADTPARLLAAIGTGASQVDIALDAQHPAVTTEAAQKLGIKEPVGTTTTWNGQPQVKSFTTYYAAAQPRAANIHRIADLVRGAVIKPGETFSLDGRVGAVAATDGFVLAGAFRDGQQADQVGGGVSQFSTTLFNAAFFAGLDIVSYQAHPIYFSGYPYGREATLGFPAPDQKIRNATPYAVLVWTSYTATSVTVTLYSTQNVYGEQTAQTRTKAGPCDVVTTTRTRHYADGHTGTDTFRAVYAPDYGVVCG